MPGAGPPQEPLATWGCVGDGAATETTQTLRGWHHHCNPWRSSVGGHCSPSLLQKVPDKGKANLKQSLGIGCCGQVVAPSASPKEADRPLPAATTATGTIHLCTPTATPPGPPSVLTGPAAPSLLVNDPLRQVLLSPVVSPPPSFHAVSGRAGATAGELTAAVRTKQEDRERPLPHQALLPQTRAPGQALLLIPAQALSLTESFRRGPGRRQGSPPAGTTAPVPLCPGAQSPVWPHRAWSRLLRTLRCTGRSRCGSQPSRRCCVHPPT